MIETPALHRRELIAIGAALPLLAAPVRPASGAGMRVTIGQPPPVRLERTGLTLAFRVAPEGNAAVADVDPGDCAAAPGTGPTAWSGALLRAPPPMRFRAATGGWIVPAPGGAARTCRTAAWIALDQPGATCRSLPRIGMTIEAEAGMPRAMLWWQWWLHDASAPCAGTIHGLPCGPGTRIDARMAILGPQAFHAAFAATPRGGDTLRADFTVTARAASGTALPDALALGGRAACWGMQDGGNCSIHGCQAWLRGEEASVLDLRRARLVRGRDWRNHARRGARLPVVRRSDETTLDIGDDGMPAEARA